MHDAISAHTIIPRTDDAALRMFRSVFTTADAFVFRCVNDRNYTMQQIEGHVQKITGYWPEDVVGNATRSFFEITWHEDTDRVFGIVDDAIAKQIEWDMSYRLRHVDGHPVWIRERAGAVRNGEGEIEYL